MQVPPSMEGTVFNANHVPIARYTRVMNITCVHCRVPVENNTEFWALHSPYSGVLHPHCAPYYNYANSWPHPSPAVCYAASPMQQP